MFNCCFACTVIQFNTFCHNQSEEKKMLKWDAKSRTEIFASEYITKSVVCLLNMLRCFCSFIQETSFVVGSATSSAAVAAKAFLSIICHSVVFSVFFHYLQTRYQYENQINNLFKRFKIKYRKLYFFVYWKENCLNTIWKENYMKVIKTSYKRKKRRRKKIILSLLPIMFSLYVKVKTSTIFDMIKKYIHLLSSVE